MKNFKVTNAHLKALRDSLNLASITEEDFEILSKPGNICNAVAALHKESQMFNPFQFYSSNTKDLEVSSDFISALVFTSAPMQKGDIRSLKCIDLNKDESVTAHTKSLSELMGGSKYVYKRSLTLSQLADFISSSKNQYLGKSVWCYVKRNKKKILVEITICDDASASLDVWNYKAEEARHELGNVDFFLFNLD